jgi:hypothetical protein
MKAVLDTRFFMNSLENKDEQFISEKKLKSAR